MVRNARPGMHCKNSTQLRSRNRVEETSAQCSDTVGWVTGSASGLQQFCFGNPLSLWNTPCRRVNENRKSFQLFSDRSGAVRRRRPLTSAAPSRSKSVAGNFTKASPECIGADSIVFGTEQQPQLQSLQDAANECNFMEYIVSKFSLL